MLSEPLAALETPQGKRLRNNLTLAIQSLVQTLDRGVLVDDPDNTRTAALVALARMAQIRMSPSHHHPSLLYAYSHIFILLCVAASGIP
ncbi:hypothetical protein M408DRAFT_329721 [Serendipita vermifera MAFF 305830]|uniref:Uncharacterized protein n=1 Tax=Serendipita vermifera MAFF 305830 TaxID=933852 RepID=A0A0C2XG77_SERVB|nr:hypothetical protein M408DRAFT_329721 [Serendipita vermifera MAFF 305830]